DNAQFKSQTVIALAAPKPLFHLTLLLCVEKVSTYSRTGQDKQKSLPQGRLFCLILAETVSAKVMFAKRRLMPLRP
ncbi:hypothetical protein ACQ4WP_28780, partial [Janthinobacterium sp. GB4P2]|uniref:hypothetical protein n=1 Tax=Janthinobacterium sp. GB4P2 TaxID=3424189 RepID=UPI003F223BD8